MENKREGKITAIINRRRMDVQFSPGPRPPRYHIVHILDETDTVITKATVWKDRESGPLWQDQGEDWVRCWGKTSKLKPSLRVIDTGQIENKVKYFDKLLMLLTHFVKSLGFPKSDVKVLKEYPPLDNPDLVATLTEILDGVVEKLGFKVAMLATYEGDGKYSSKNDSSFPTSDGELPLRIIRHKPGVEWVWEWGEDIIDMRSIGRTLVLRDCPENVAVKAVRRAQQGESDTYGITLSLYNLWDFIYPHRLDMLLLWSFQLLAGIGIIITIPFFIKTETGKPQIIGNMYAGHTRWWLTKKDIAALNAFVEQASLAMQREELYHLAQDKALKAEEAAFLAQERALAAETLAGMADFGSKMAHRMVNHVGLAKMQLERLIKRKEKEGLKDDFIVLKDILEILEQASETIEQMRRPFRAVHKVPTKVSECLKQVLLEEVKLPPGIEVRIDEDIAELPKVEADNNLAEVFKVLINNACEAMGNTGTINIEGGNLIQGKCTLSISDTGPGIPSEIGDKIFELFYTTKSKTGGAGLGLWWVRTYLTRIRGSIQLKSSVGNGTTFIIVLPLAENV